MRDRLSDRIKKKVNDPKLGKFFAKWASILEQQTGHTVILKHAISMPIKVISFTAFAPKSDDLSFMKLRYCTNCGKVLSANHTCVYAIPKATIVIDDVPTVKLRDPFMPDPRWKYNTDVDESR